MKLYRYEDVQFASMPYDDHVGSEIMWTVWPAIVLHEYEVERETPCGYVISFRSWYSDKGKWVSKTSKKCFAHADLDKAWKSFQCRKKRQIEIYSARLRRAEAALALPQPTS